jgi:Zn-dependent protease with chaperone function
MHWSLASLLSPHSATMPLCASSRPARLNPFAFVSDTTFRLVLLLVFVIAADVWDWQTIAGKWFGLDQSFEKCLGSVPLIGESMLQGPSAKIYKHCASTKVMAELPGVGIGVSLLFTATAILYYFYPTLRVRRLRLRRYTQENDAPFRAVLAELCIAAGLKRPPEFWENRLGSWAPFVFGHSGCYRVAISGGFKHRCGANPELFKAVMLHEFAHIRNGDVSKAYFALAIWWAFVATALAPNLIFLGFGASSWFEALDTAVEAVAVSSLVLLTRNAVLRARELYADARGSAPDPSLVDPELVRRTLGELFKERPASWPWYLLSSHPHPAHRKELLASTDTLLRLGFWNTFAAGVAAGVTVLLAIFWASTMWVERVPEDAETSWLAMMTPLIAPLATVLAIVLSAISIVTWRAVFLSVMRGGKARGSLATSVALAAGILLGGVGFPVGVVLAGIAVQLPEASLVQVPSIPIPALIIGVLFLILLLGLVLACGVLAYIKWVEIVASSWLPAMMNRRAPGFLLWAGIIGSCILALPWFSLLTPFTWMLVTEPLRDGKAFGTLLSFWRLLVGSISVFPLNCITWVSLIALWGVPFAAVPWKRPAFVGRGCWAFLDRDIDPGQVPLTPTPFYIRRALLIAAAGAVAAAIATRWLRIELPSGALLDAGISDRAAHSVQVSTIVTCIVAQAAIAAVIAASVPKLGFIHGMFGAFVAGWILVFVQYAQLAIAGRPAPIGLLVGLVIIGGALLALSSSALGWLFAAPIRAIFAHRRILLGNGKATGAGLDERRA